MTDNLVTVYRKRTKIIACIDIIMRAIMLYIVYGAVYIFALLFSYHWSQENFLQEWKIEYLHLIATFILAVIVVALYAFELLAVIKLWKCVKVVSISEVTSLARFWKVTAIISTIFYVLITMLVINFSSASEEFKPAFFTDLFEISIYVLEVAIKLVGFVVVTNFTTQVTTTLQNPWEGVELNGFTSTNAREENNGNMC